jgi:hypothetical protein
MLRSGWSEDLGAWVKSWDPADQWLDDPESIHAERWRRDGYVNLRAVFGQSLDLLPTGYNRRELFALSQGEPCDPLMAFLAVMAWGHNNNSVGASRVDRLAAAPGVKAKIDHIIEEARAGRVEAAFEACHEVKGLGTAFASKVLYFAAFGSAEAEVHPLILDSVVEQALREVIDPESGESSVWPSQTRDWEVYKGYCDLLRRIRDTYVPDARIDAVELWLWLTGGGWCWHRAAIRRNGRYPLP